MAEDPDAPHGLRIDVALLEACTRAGWLVPRGADAAAYSELEIARACLIRDLRETMGVNDEGVTVALSLIDQIHGLRRALRRVAAAMHGLPEPVRHEVLLVMRDLDEEPEQSA